MLVHVVCVCSALRQFTRVDAGLCLVLFGVRWRCGWMSGLLLCVTFWRVMLCYDFVVSFFKGLSVNCVFGIIGGLRLGVLYDDEGSVVF